MTAPVDVMPLNAFESDTLEWVVRADTCAMVVRSFGPTGRAYGFGGSWASMSEGTGTMGPGSSIDVSPSPDWRRLAFTSSIRLPTDSTRWENAIEGVKLSFAEARRVAERGADGTLWVRFAVVEPDPEGCMGGGCKTPLVSPVHGGSRIAWTADSRYLLLARRDDSLNWTVIDPTSRQAVAVKAQTPHQFVWQTRAVSTASNPRLAHDIAGGSYRFTTRGDSILVRGPDRNGQITDRIVGAGVPVAVTRNGQYLLAVRPEGGRTRAFIYSFRLFHAMMQSSCDA
jgi:hypothetical protein